MSTVEVPNTNVDDPLSQRCSVVFRSGNVGRKILKGRLFERFGQRGAPIKSVYWGDLVVRVPIGRPWVLIVNTDEDPAVERPAVETLLEKQVDGLIVVVASASEHPHLESRNLRQTPVILVNRCIDQLSLTSVTTVDFNGARMAVEYALSRGHRRLGFAVGVGPVRVVAPERPSGLISTTQHVNDHPKSGLKSP